MSGKLSDAKPVKLPRQPNKQVHNIMKSNKQQKKIRRHARIRARLSGTGAKPRLHVSRSLSGVFVQLIDDTKGLTLVSVRARKDTPKAGAAGERKGKVAKAYLVGLSLAAKAKEAGITKAVFDRGGNKYHGRVKAVADGARDGGLEF